MFKIRRLWLIVAAIAVAGVIIGAVVLSSQEATVNMVSTQPGEVCVPNDPANPCPAPVIDVKPVVNGVASVRIDISFTDGTTKTLTAQQSLLSVFEQETGKQIVLVIYTVWVQFDTDGKYKAVHIDNAKIAAYIITPTNGSKLITDQGSIKFPSDAPFGSKLAGGGLGVSFQQIEDVTSKIGPPGQYTLRFITSFTWVPIKEDMSLDGQPRSASISGPDIGIETAEGGGWTLP